jgi:hypothetical protein
MVFDKAADSAGEVEITAVPTKEWTVALELTPRLVFSVTVNAESAEDAEEKAYKLVQDVADDGISNVLDLAEYCECEVFDLDIGVYGAEPIAAEEDAELAQPTTATENSAA